MAKYLVRLMHYVDDKNAEHNNDVGTIKAEYEVEFDTYDEALDHAIATTPEAELGDQLGVFWSKNNTEVR